MGSWKSDHLLLKLMDKYLERLKKQLQDILDTVNAFDAEPVQVRIADLLLPYLEARGKHGPAEPEYGAGDNLVGQQKKPGAKKSLEALMLAGFFDTERSMAEIVKELQESGMDFRSTQISGILLGLVNARKLRRYHSPVNHRYIYLKGIL